VAEASLYGCISQTNRRSTRNRFEAQDNPPSGASVLHIFVSERHPNRVIGKVRIPPAQVAGPVKSRSLHIPVMLLGHPLTILSMVIVTQWQRAATAHENVLHITRMEPSQ